MLCPDNAALLKQAGDVYEKMGETDNAVLCYRGVIPDEAERRYFSYYRAQSEPSVVTAPKVRRSLSPITSLTRLCSARFCPPEADKGRTHLPASGSDSVPLESPVQFPPGEKYPQFRRLNTEPSDTFTSVIDNGEVWFDGINTLIRDQYRGEVPEHSKGNICVALAASLTREPTRLSGKACFLDARSSRIYYHWMLDVLPKLRVLELSNIRITDIDHFIVRAHTAFQTDTLAHFGIDQAKIVVADDIQFFNAETLVVPFLKNDLGKRIYSGLGIGIPKWVPEYLSCAFLPDNNTPAPAPNRIYISRATRGTRSIDNESEFIRLIKQRQFTVVNLENYSVREQATLLNGASIVVGNHGAGLTNIVFCQAESKVVEIFSDYKVPCYWSLANLKQLKYFQFFATHPVNTKNSARTVSSDRDKSLVINLTDFFSWFDEIVEPS